jgi:phosphoglycolate phosphatase
MRRFASVFFDLDGTLVDPGDGIANTIQFVLNSLDVNYRFDSSARWYIGPPLSQIFAKLLSAPAQNVLIQRAVSLYIERFASHGALESVVYPGIIRLLAELYSGTRLFLVTSKDTAVAEQMLCSHSLRDYFDGVIGTESDSRFAAKADAVRFMLQKFDLKPGATAIVGDRMHDIIAGRANAIYTVGVTYGFGTEQELIEAGADKICASPGELLEFLRK